MHELIINTHISQARMAHDTAHHRMCIVVRLSIARFQRYYYFYTLAQLPHGIIKCARLYPTAMCVCCCFESDASFRAATRNWQHNETMHGHQHSLETVRIFCVSLFLGFRCFVSGGLYSLLIWWLHLSLSHFIIRVHYTWVPLRAFGAKFSPWNLFKNSHTQPTREREERENEIFGVNIQRKLDSNWPQFLFFHFSFLFATRSIYKLWEQWTDRIE